MTISQTGSARSQRIQTAKTTSMTSCALAIQTESVRASEQPRTASPQAINSDAESATGSIPPSKVPSAATGKAQAIRLTTGTSRAPSLPRTTSRSVSSVTMTWASVPRALSRQIAPAVAAGAARSTRANSVIVIVKKNDSPAWTICCRVVRYWLCCCVDCQIRPSPASRAITNSPRRAYPCQRRERVSHSNAKTGPRPSLDPIGPPPWCLLVGGTPPI